MDEWDFEGEVTFLTPEEGGLEEPPTTGIWASFRDPEIEDGTPFIARPVAGFLLDRTSYDSARMIAKAVVLRFQFPDRARYEAHRERLLARRRFDVWEGARVVGRGDFSRRREDVPPIEAEIERLLADLGGIVPAEEVKGVLEFLYHSEWECALHLLWGALSGGGCPIEETERVRLLDLARRVDMDLPQMERDLPLRRVD